MKPNQPAKRPDADEHDECPQHIRKAAEAVLGRLREREQCQRARDITGLSMLARRLAGGRFCSRAERRRLYETVQDAIEMGGGSLYRLVDLHVIIGIARRFPEPPNSIGALVTAIDLAVMAPRGWAAIHESRRALRLKAHELAFNQLPELRRRLRALAKSVRKRSGTPEGDGANAATGRRMSAELLALFLLEPGATQQVRAALSSDGEKAAKVLRKVAELLKRKYGGKGRRTSNGPNFDAVVALAMRAFDIAEFGTPVHLGMPREPPGAHQPPETARGDDRSAARERKPPVSFRSIASTRDPNAPLAEMGPRVTFTRALLDFAFPDWKSGPRTVTDVLNRFYRR